MTIKSIILLSVILITASCKGQIKPQNLELQTSKNKLGQIVPTLPEAIWSILQDEDEHYWFGSNGYGVFFYDGKKIINYTKKDGLASNQIRAIQSDKFGHLYFDTPNGVTKYDGKKFKTLKPVYSALNQWTSEPDDLWFKLSGDINGVYRYDGATLFHLPFPEKDLEEAFREQVKNNLPISLALFPSYFVKNTRRNYGYACVFCLV